jgi:RNA polymerase sigma factor (sigma-70 family)
MLVDVRLGIREDSTMNSDDTTRTSSTLLRRTADWRDHAAWQEFVARYDPLIRCWCREYRLDDDLAEDVSQLFWIELADKMRSFHYDPSQRFRGWLRRCFHWRAVDALRKRNREELVVQSLDDTPCMDFERSLVGSEQPDVDGDDLAPRRLLLLDLAEQVQAAVRDKVQPQSWQVFWHVAVDGWSTRQTADALKMTYLATHAAYKRVSDRLAEEGARRLAELDNSTTDTRPSR